MTPVTGIKPITTARFINAWKIIWKIRPKAKYLANKSLVFKAIFIPKYNKEKNNKAIKTAPTTPNSSQIIEKIKSQADIIIIDFHGEATAEKIAMGYYLDGRVTCVFGTHTHVQTADEKILEKGTGYITDIGMTGPKNSVIGMDTEASLKRFITSLPERYKLANGDCILCGAIIDINDECCRTENIDRIYLK